MAKVFREPVQILQRVVFQSRFNSLISHNDCCRPVARLPVASFCVRPSYHHGATFLGTFVALARHSWFRDNSWPTSMTHFCLVFSPLLTGVERRRNVWLKHSPHYALVLQGSFVNFRPPFPLCSRSYLWRIFCLIEKIHLVIVLLYF